MGMKVRVLSCSGVLRLPYTPPPSGSLYVCILVGLPYAWLRFLCLMEMVVRLYLYIHSIQLPEGRS